MGPCWRQLRGSSMTEHRALPAWPPACGAPRALADPLPLSTVAQTRFVEEPEDQTVVAGQRIVLSCVVLNYSGIVQWTKDGLALGMGQGLKGTQRGCRRFWGRHCVGQGLSPSGRLSGRLLRWLLPSSLFPSSLCSIPGCHEAGAMGLVPRAPEAKHQLGLGAHALLLPACAGVPVHTGVPIHTGVPAHTRVPMRTGVPACTELPTCTRDPTCTRSLLTAHVPTRAGTRYRQRAACKLAAPQVCPGCTQMGRS